jgi:hypothetical protein
MFLTPITIAIRARTQRDPLQSRASGKPACRALSRLLTWREAKRQSKALERRSKALESAPNSLDVIVAPSELQGRRHEDDAYGQLICESAIRCHLQGLVQQWGFCKPSIGGVRRGTTRETLFK